jgi:hypothetical protein
MIGIPVSYSPGMFSGGTWLRAGSPFVTYCGGDTFNIAGMPGSWIVGSGTYDAATGTYGYSTVVGFSMHPMEGDIVTGIGREGAPTREFRRGATSGSGTGGAGFAVKHG